MARLGSARSSKPISPSPYHLGTPPSTHLTSLVHAVVRGHRVQVKLGEMTDVMGSASSPTPTEPVLSPARPLGHALRRSYSGREVPAYYSDAANYSPNVSPGVDPSNQGPIYGKLLISRCSVCNANTCFS